jgi:hypothetical protein
MTILVCAAFIAWLVWQEAREKVPPLHTSICAVFVCFLAVYPRYDNSSVYLRYLVIFLLCASLVVLVRGITRHASARLPISASLAAVALMIAIAVASNYVLPSVAAAPNISSPLRDGTYYVVQGGRNLLLNHHRRSVKATAQRYAIDFTKLTASGRWSEAWLPGSDPSKYLIFDEPVHSPCDGVILLKADGFRDLPVGQEDPANPAGNYLAIGCDMGLTIVLAHLRPGIDVGIGERVRLRQPLGRVGNSGSTTDPHLHMHAVSGMVSSERDALFLGEGVEVLVEDTVMYRGKTLTAGAP